MRGKYKDLSERQKSAIMFDDHTVSEVALSVHVSKRIVQSVCKEWCNSGGHEARRQNCGWKKILPEELETSITHCR